MCFALPFAQMAWVQGRRPSTLVETATLYVEGGSDIETTDRVEIDGIMFEVTGKRTPGHRKAGDRHFYHILSAASDSSL